MEKIIYIFFRQNNDFEDILKDKNLIKYFDIKVSWHQHLMLTSFKLPPDVSTYILLKYGDSVINSDRIITDRTPKPFVDYYPSSKRPKAFENIYK